MAATLLPFHRHLDPCPPKAPRTSSPPRALLLVSLAISRHMTKLTVIPCSHLLFLAFFYNLTGLTGREKSTTGSWTAQALGIRNVANEPLDQWCTRHKVWKGMRQEVLEPLYAAVSTVGRAEVGALPIGEILDYIVATFGSSRKLFAANILAHS